MAKYLKLTPKVATALGVGLLAVVAIAVANHFALAEVQAGAASVLVLVLTTLGGYLKRDQSSPEPDDHGVEL